MQKEQATLWIVSIVAIVGIVSMVISAVGVGQTSVNLPSETASGDAMWPGVGGGSVCGLKEYCVVKSDGSRTCYDQDTRQYITNCARA